MRFGVIASALLHLCAVGLLFVSIPEGWRPQVAPEPYVPIEIISQAELAEKTSVPAAAPEPKPEPEPEPAPPEPEKVAPPKPEEKKPEPKPEPEPAPPPKPEEKKPEPPKEKPKPKPKPKEPEDLDLDRLSALVDKAKKEEPAPATTPSETAQQSDRPQQQVGAGDRLAASDIAKMKAAVSRCWQTSALVGAPEPEKLVVQVQFELNPDGRLKSQPRVVNSLQISLSGNQFWKVAEQVAVRAVISCQPYDFLAPERYEIWKEMQLNFDPREMAGF